MWKHATSRLKAQGLADAQPAEDLPIRDVLSTDDDVTVGQALNSAEPVAVAVDSGDAQLRRRIQQGYATDTFFIKILDKPKEHSRFHIEHQLIYMMNTSGAKVLCVPRDRLLITTILEQAHNIVGHFGYQKTLEYTDGQTEHANRNVAQIFRAFVCPDQKDWVDRIPLVEFAINASISETTGYAPFELNSGYMPSMIKELHTDEVIHCGVKEFAQNALMN
ncbi:hypothetical protein C0992_007874 [Termitomyces sp. T32_za158]|nr:hypothetical protein C0992_007874 [Termitomyces sp. T32_za158]